MRGIVRSQTLAVELMIHLVGPVLVVINMRMKILMMTLMILMILVIINMRMMKTMILRMQQSGGQGEVALYAQL